MYGHTSLTYIEDGAEVSRKLDAYLERRAKHFGCGACALYEGLRPRTLDAIYGESGVPWQ